MAKFNEVLISTLVQNGRIDADFFQKKYIELDKVLSDGLIISNISKTVDLQSNGSFKTIFDILAKQGDKVVPYIRSGNVGDFFIKKEELHYITKEAHAFLNKTHTKYGDILMARKGKIGGATLITEDDIDLNSNDNVVNIRLKDDRFLPEYLVTFWNTKYGLSQIERFATGNVQPWLSMKQVRMLKSVLLDKKDQNQIRDIIIDAKEQNQKSKSLYLQAKKLLEEELGLKNFVLKKLKSYESSFNEIVCTNRMDADYYQVYFRQQQTHLSTLKTKTLRQIVNFTRGIEVGSSSYTDTGKLFIRVSNIKENGVATTNSDKYIDQKTYEKLKEYKPAVGEILLTKDGTLGVCYVVDANIEGIISSGIMKMSIKDKNIPAEYLSLVINSSICRFQIEQNCSGALILHWKPRDIAALKIPILSDEIMNKLSDLIIKAKEAQKNSKQLLEQAKKSVEELIEKRVNI